jgi:threonine/homoserine/homoserine lactone efflux protein
VNSTGLSLFLFAALMIAVVPGPGIFYVMARTLSGGRRVGLASTFGTGLGGLVHVVAGSLGVSAIILASAELFAALKLIGAISDLARNPYLPRSKPATVAGGRRADA